MIKEYRIMLHTIENAFLRMTVDDVGAEMVSLAASDGTEYLWNGDSTYWSGHAPNLFPYVGRLTDDTYTFGGERYQMNRHGFSRRESFDTQKTEPDRIIFRLAATSRTKAVYPWEFVFSVTYALNENTVSITYNVENRDSRDMYFGLGAHPGFRVPLETGKCFTDYRLTFAQPCRPSRVEMSDSCMITGCETPYPLENHVSMPLRHDLFDRDAVILKNMDRTVTLSAGEGTKGVTLSIPRMRYLGVWHTPHSDAPFVCLEPWASLPSRQDIVEDFAQQNDLIPLSPGETYQNRWTITLF